MTLQVGVTPEGVEVPRSLVDEEMQEKLKEMPKELQPSIPKGADRKWRYMWRVGPRPSETRFQVSFFVFLRMFTLHYYVLTVLVQCYCSTCHHDDGDIFLF